MKAPLTVVVAIGLAASFLVAGCSATVGEGPAVTVNRDVASFDAVEVANGISVAVTIGGSGQLSVTAPANIEPIVTTSVDGTTLKIGASGSFVVTTAVQVAVSTPILESIKATGGSRATAAGLDVQRFTVRLDGGSVGTASGSTANLRLEATGGSRAELGALGANAVSVDISGGSTAMIRSSGQVSGTASGGSRLDVTGGGTVTVEATGGAQVVTH